MKKTQKGSSGFCTLVDINSAIAKWDCLAQKVLCLPEPKNAGLVVVSGSSINPARPVQTEQGMLKEVMLIFDSKGSRSACGDQKYLWTVANVH